jgi:hypothetical protein
VWQFSSPRLYFGLPYKALADLAPLRKVGLRPVRETGVQTVVLVALRES